MVFSWCYHCFSFYQFPSSQHISKVIFFFPERNSWNCSDLFPWNNCSEILYKAILYVSNSFAPFCCDQQGLVCCLLCQEKKKPQTQHTAQKLIWTYFFLMNLEKILILCFPWQTALKNYSENMCFYPFIQLLPCRSHSFSHFFQYGYSLTYSPECSAYTHGACVKKDGGWKLHFFCSREMNKLFPELWRLVNTELLWFYCAKKSNCITIIHSLIRKIIFALYTNWRGKFASHRCQ